MVALSRSTVACSVEICCMRASNAAFGMVISSTLLAAFLKNSYTCKIRQRGVKSFWKHCISRVFGQQTVPGFPGSKAFFWTMDSPSMSHRNSCRVSSFSSCSFLGH